MNHLGEDPVINGAMTHETLRGVGFLCMAIYSFFFFNSSTKKLVEAHLVWDVSLKGSWGQKLGVFNGEVDGISCEFQKPHVFRDPNTSWIFPLSRISGVSCKQEGHSLDVHWMSTGSSNRCKLQDV